RSRRPPCVLPFRRLALGRCRTGASELQPVEHPPGASTSMRLVSLSESGLGIAEQEISSLLEPFVLRGPRGSEAAWIREVARRKRFKWLRADETIHVLARRDTWILVYHIVIPVIIGLLGSWALVESFLVEMPVLRFLGVAGFLIGLLWGAWAYIDWENDFYIVTDKRVVYVEKIVLLYDSIQEAPLETIQTINVSSENFI
ncbi:MAG: hypothetical protein HC806_08030, partial [Anaerolineae bacterium]|nr:hypothetical protein [Anaerolineae bacterium]